MSGGGGEEISVERLLLVAAQAAVGMDVAEAGRSWADAFNAFDVRNRAAAAKSGGGRSVEKDLSNLCQWLCDVPESKFIYVVDALFRVAKYLAYLPGSKSWLFSGRSTESKKPAWFSSLLDLVGKRLTEVWTSARGIDTLCDGLRNASAQLRNSLLASVHDFMIGGAPWSSALASWLQGRAIFSYSAFAPLIFATARDRNAVQIRLLITDASTFTFSNTRMAMAVDSVAGGQACVRGEWTPSAKEFVRRFKLLIEWCFADMEQRNDAIRAVTKDMIRALARNLRDPAAHVTSSDRMKAAVIVGSQIIEQFGAVSNTVELRLLLDEMLSPVVQAVAAFVDAVVSVYGLPDFLGDFPKSYIRTLGDGRLQNDPSGNLLLLLIQECFKRDAEPGGLYSRRLCLLDIDRSMCNVALSEGHQFVADSIIARMMCALPLPSATLSWAEALPNFLEALKTKHPATLTEYATARVVSETEYLDYPRAGIARGIASSIQSALNLQFGETQWPVAAWVHLVGKLRLRYRGPDAQTEVVRGALVSAASHECPALRPQDFDVLSTTLLSGGVDMRRLMEDRAGDVKLGTAESSGGLLRELPALYVSLCDAIAGRFAAELRGHGDQMVGLVAMCETMKSWGMGARDANDTPAPANALQAAFAACVLTAVAASIRSSRCLLKGAFSVAFAAVKWERPAGRLAHVAALDVVYYEAGAIVDGIQSVQLALGSDADDGLLVRWAHVQEFRPRFLLIAAAAGASDVSFVCSADGVRIRSCGSHSECFVEAARCEAYKCGRQISFRVATPQIKRFLVPLDDASPLTMSLIESKADETALRFAVDLDWRKSQADVPIRNFESDAVYKLSDFSNNELDLLISAPRDVAAILRLLDRTVTDASVLARAKHHQSAARVLAEELKVLMNVDNWLKNVFRQCGQSVRDDPPIEGLDQLRLKFATGRQLAAAKALLSQRILLGSKDFSFTPAEVDWEATLHCIKHFISKNSITFRDQFTAKMLPLTMPTKLHVLSRLKHYQFVKDCTDEVLTKSKRMVLTDDDLRIADLESDNMRRLAHHGETMLKVSARACQCCIAALRDWLL